MTRQHMTTQITSGQRGKKTNTKKDTLQILKDPFIMSGCAVNLAE